MVPEATFRSYYGHPVLKQPVWKWEIPTYFYLGGLAGGSLMLAAAARMQRHDDVARRASFTALGCIGASTALLINDLGKPSRFYNMLRVVKVTSPMSIGTWVLSATGGLAGVATACDVLGVLPRVKSSAGLGAAALSSVLSTYTAALIADTAVPVWHEARFELPFIFGATSLATAGAASMLLNSPQVGSTARAMSIGGAAAATLGVEVMERRLGDQAQPYHEGRAMVLGRAAKALIAAGGVTAAVAGRQRIAATVAACSLLAGGLCERWSIFEAGRASAADPKYTVLPQRERLSRAGGVRGAEATPEVVTA